MQRFHRFDDRVPCRRHRRFLLRDWSPAFQFSDNCVHWHWEIKIEEQVDVDARLDDTKYETCMTRGSHADTTTPLNPTKQTPSLWHPSTSYHSKPINQGSIGQSITCHVKEHDTANTLPSNDAPIMRHTNSCTYRSIVF